MPLQLRPRVAITSLLIAFPAALLLLYAITSIRAADASLALERFVTSQINDQVRERCESDPMWFLTGPLPGRPPHGIVPNADPDALGPRPKPDEQPFELFAYDEDFLGSSTATPHFPTDLRLGLRRSSKPIIEPFDTKDGAGLQMATWTGWITGPCAVFLGRMRPAPHAFRSQLELFGGLLFVCYAVALLAVAPTVFRIRRLAGDAREASREQHASIAPDRKRDEISSIAFVYNETAKTLHERTTGTKDRDEALRRFIEDAAGLARPLDTLSARLGTLEMRDGVQSGLRSELREAVREAHGLEARLSNLTMAAELHARRGPFVRETLDLDPLLARVVSRYEALARAMDVTLHVTVPSSPVIVSADQAKLDRAFGNLIDNAIRHNRAGGRVDVELSAGGGGSFVLKILDNGRGVTDDELKSLTAIRRFRGDEGRERRPGVPGLGLAVAREVIERLGWKLDLGRPATGGFEVEVSGTSGSTSPAPSAR
jgi:signal transduction histidine kinase